MPLLKHFLLRNGFLLFIYVCMGISPAAAAVKVTPTESLTNAIKKNVGEYSYSLALQAASWGAPIVTMYNLRYNCVQKPGSQIKPNQILQLDQNGYPNS
jgi:hypothetical protein